jgi:AraC-like DNA-binding protein
VTTDTARDLRALLSNLVHETVHLWDQPVPATPPDLKPPVRALQRQVRLSDKRIADLIAKHEAGRTVRQLAVEFDINRETVLEHLKRANVPRRPNVRKLTDQQVARAAELYATNLSLVKVAAHFGVNPATIRREFAVAGIPVRPRRGWENR